MEIKPLFTAKATAREAHEQICPYSHATRGNVQVDLTVQGS
jgi:organic hydroperoxide reductase OsmC/OhrA